MKELCRERIDTQTPVKTAVNTVEPYIAMSGIGRYQDRIDTARAVNLRTDKDLPKVIAGIQATTKTQALGIENKHGREWHPVGDSIWETVSGISTSSLLYETQPDSPYTNQHTLTEPYIHYSFDQRASTPEAVYTQITSLLYRQHIYQEQQIYQQQSHLRPDQTLQGIQLNNLPVLQPEYWPLLQRIADNLNLGDCMQDKLHIICQIGRSTLDSTTPQELAESWYATEQMVGRKSLSLLLDTSGGTGQPADREQYARYIQAIGEKSNTTVGVAGGYGPGKLQDYAWLVERFGPLSIDAESGLRERHPSAFSRFCSLRGAEYVLDAANILSSTKPITSPHPKN